MKRKYAAMVLGLALSVTSMNVFAAETELAQTEMAEDGADTQNLAETVDDGAADDGTVEISEEETDSEAAETTAVWGEVTAAEEGSITIKLADLQETDGTEDTAAAETEASAETGEGAEAESAADETAASGAESYAGVFTYNGEEMNIMLNEETVVQLIYQDADAKKMQELAEKYSDTTAAAKLTAAEEVTDEDVASEAEVKESDTDAAEEPSETDTEESSAAETVEASTAESETDAAEPVDAEETADEEPIVAELSIDAVLEGDMVYATIDDSGNAINVIVFMPESSADAGEVFVEDAAKEADSAVTEDSTEDDTVGADNAATETAEE